MLQNADDTLFFCKENIKNIFNIKVILNFFELPSGLKFIFFKSKLSGIGVDQTEILRFATILNCNVMRTHFKYLGDVIRGLRFGMKWSIE